MSVRERERVGVGERVSVFERVSEKESVRVLADGSLGVRIESGPRMQIQRQIFKRT